MRGPARGPRVGRSLRWRDRIEALFHDSYDRIAETASVTIFLPTLAERLTIERLDALAQAEGKKAKRVPEVLYVCVGNAGRSQMAAALTRHHAGRHLHIRTGGSNPAQAIHPEVEWAMAELGLFLHEEFPKPLTDEVLAAADVVITMGCGSDCPVLPGRRYEEWPTSDPAGKSVEQARSIRDDIDCPGAPASGRPRARWRVGTGADGPRHRSGAGAGRRAGPGSSPDPGARHADDLAAQGVSATRAVDAQRRSCLRPGHAAHPAVGASFRNDIKTVNTHILRLRRKIETDRRHPTRIRTVRGYGYIFDVDPVES
jgi:arsenate reductase